jgi:hypothetical protein
MDLPLERLEIRLMASGDESLLLTERVGWEAFPMFAETILGFVEGTVVDRADTPVERVWTVRIESWQGFHVVDASTVRRLVAQVEGWHAQDYVPTEKDFGDMEPRVAGSSETRALTRSSTGLGSLAPAVRHAAIY